VRCGSRSVSATIHAHRRAQVALQIQLTTRNVRLNRGLQAMIALLASDEETPKLVKYLTDQFYAQNYSIQQRHAPHSLTYPCGGTDRGVVHRSYVLFRVDMLVVMAEAAKELADSSLAPMFPPSSSHPHAKAIEAPAGT